MIIQFRIVDRALTPLIGLDDSAILKLIELLRENIAVVGPAKPKVFRKQPLRCQHLYRWKPF